jgi:hypothetical protein
MTRFISTLVSDYIIDSIAQDICGFTFAFIAPLGTEQNNRWHLISLSPRNLPAPCCKSSLVVLSKAYAQYFHILRRWEN